MSFVVKPCAGGTVFVINFSGLRRLDLKEVIQKLRGTKFKVAIETPEVLLVKSGESEITVCKSGKLLAKNVKTREDAGKLAEEFGKIIGANQ